MRIVSSQFLTGPNLYGDHSALLIETDFGIPPDRLLQPTALDLNSIGNLGAIDGLVEMSIALEATLAPVSTPRTIADLMLELAWRLQDDHVIEGFRGRVVARKQQSLVALVPADSDVVALQAWVLAVSTVVLLLPGRDVDRNNAEGLTKLIRKFVHTTEHVAPGLMGIAIARAARKLDIPVYRTDFGSRRLQYGQGRFSHLGEGTLIEPYSSLSVTHVRNKWKTIGTLRRMGLPTLQSALAVNEAEAVAAAERIGSSVVIKPAASDKGAGITLDIQSPEEVREAYLLAAQFGPAVLVEEFGAGDDHRILVVDGRMIACSKRVPAHVVGDGRSSIGQLIEQVNADPRRGEGSKVLEKIRIDSRVSSLLSKQSFTLESVPSHGQWVLLSLAANVSQGGTAVDVTAQVHPDNREAVERAARILRLNVTGIDFLSPDISKSWREGAGWILELNVPCGLRPHWIANPEQDVVTPILRASFPEGAPARIPTAGITGSLGKTTTCQMLAAIARAAGRTAGLSTTQGIWSGDFHVETRDWSSGGAAARLLTDPTIDMGIFEFARGALIKGGMVIDGIDVAAVLNVQDNHLGLDGIETREQLAAVKSIIVRSARRAAVLNADDPLVLRMRELVKRASVTLVSFDPANSHIVQHRDAGGSVVVLDGPPDRAVVRLLEKQEIILELPLSNMPATLGGRSRSVTSNALFAVGVAYHLGLSVQDIGKGLAGFTSDSTQNPGRHNAIDGLPFELMLNWADGAVAVGDTVATLAGQPVSGKRRILLTTVGNRSDEWIRDMAAVTAGHFDVYCCADSIAHLRGREIGAVPALFADGLRSCGVPEGAIVRIDASANPFLSILESAEAGDRVVMTTYEVEDALKQIEYYKRKLNAGPPERVEQHAGIANPPL